MLEEYNPNLMREGAKNILEKKGFLEKLPEATRKISGKFNEGDEIKIKLNLFFEKKVSKGDNKINKKA